MKEQKLCKWLANITMVLTLGLGSSAFADGMAGVHKKPHSEVSGTPKTHDKTEKMEGMDMKDMDMNKMHEMMKDCMKKQEDDKMCHQEIMDKCTAKMSMEKCQSLMNDMKKHKMKK